jgi:hypothetical protein
MRCVPPAPPLHARSLELLKGQGPRWPTSARTPARRAVPAVPASSLSLDDGPSRCQPLHDCGGWFSGAVGALVAPRD